MTQFASTLYPQTNPTNPILLDIREHYRDAWPRTMIRHYNFVTKMSGQYVTQEWVRITDESQIEHARRVLTRLANFSG